MRGYVRVYRIDSTGAYSRHSRVAKSSRVMTYEGNCGVLITSAESTEDIFIMELKKVRRWPSLWLTRSRTARQPIGNQQIVAEVEKQMLRGKRKSTTASTRIQHNLALDGATVRPV